MDASRLEPPPYPPREHLLRDLGIHFASSGALRTAELPLRPQIRDAAGRPRPGAIATMVDALCGGAAMQAVAPDWSATSDLALQMLRVPAGDVLRAAARVLRAGRRTVVLEVEARDASERPEPVAFATVTFSRLPRREFQTHAFGQSGDEALAPAEPGLAVPLLERIGLREVEPSGEVEVELTPYIANSLRGVQGGVLALLADVACERAARREVGEALATADLALHYLEVGRAGPFRTRTRLLRADASAALVRVEVCDRGAGDRLLAVATAQALALPPPARVA